MKRLATLALAFLLFLSGVPLVAAFEMERPPTLTDINKRVQSLNFTEEASVGIGVHICEYKEHSQEDLFNGNDGVVLRVAATANTRKAITYKYLTYEILYDWVDANQPTGITGDNNGAWFNLPFPVRFFGGPGAQNESFTYTKVWVCGNGFLSFDNSNSTSATPSIGNPAKPNALMSVYWTDLSPAGGSIKYWADDTQFVVLWDNVLNKNNGYRETFEVVIKYQRTPTYRDQNRFMFLYRNVSGYAHVGIEDQEGYKYMCATASSGIEIEWSTEDRAGEIKEMVIIAEKSDGAAKIWMIGEPYLRGYNMHWISREGDSESLYSMALRGGLTLLMTEAAGAVGGLIGGLSMGMLLLTVELAPYFSTELYKVHELDVEHAGVTENFAYVNVSAAQDGALRWPVDAELSDTIVWVFTDDDGTHSIKLTALLKYYSFESYTEEVISTSVNVTVVSDAGNTRDDARQVEPGKYLAYVDDIYDKNDYYQLAVPSGKWVNVLMTPPSDMDFDLYLYDQYGNELDSSEETGDGIEHVYYKATYTGDYYVRVYARDGRGLYEVDMKIEDSGPPGGCPFVSVWNGIGYVTDNNLLPASETSTGIDVEDYYRLEQPLVRRDGKYYLLLSEFEREHSYFDRVRLMAVDHDVDVNVALTPTGEILTYTNPHTPLSAADKHGKDWLETINSMDSSHYQGSAGEWLLLDFGSLDTSQAVKLVLRANMEILPKSPCIHVQALNSAGEWIDAAILQTRKNMSTRIIDLSSYLQNVNDNIQIRLYFTSKHKIDYVGLDTSRSADLKIRYANLAYALHSTQGDVKDKLMKTDGTHAELLPGQQIEVAFTQPQNTRQTRTLILYTKGHYHTITSQNP